MPSVPGFVIGGAGSVEAADITDAGAAGIAALQTSTAAELAQLVDRRTVDPMTGSGWTTGTPAGGASASWGSSKLRLAVPASAAGSIGVSRSSGIIPAAASEWDVIVRVDVVDGDNSAATRIGVSAGKSSTDYVSLSMWSSGAIEIGRVIGGSYGGASFGGATGLDAAARTGGQLWLRLSSRIGEVTASWGVGTSNNPPTGWRVERRLTGTESLDVSGGTYVEFWVATTGTSVSSGLTVDFLDIRARAAASF